MRYLILYILLFVFFTGRTQEVEVRFGNVYKDPSKSTITGFFGKSNDGVYALRSKRGIFSSGEKYIEFYNNELNLEYSKEITFPNEDMYMLKSIMRNDTIFTFTSLYDDDKDQQMIYGTTINSAGEVNNTMVEIAAIKGDRKNKQGSVLVTESVDSTKFLVTILPHFSRHEKQEVAFIILDHNYKEIDQVKIEFPFEQKEFFIRSILLDGNNNIHIMASVKSQEEGAKRNDRDLRIFTYFKDTENLHEYKVEIGENYITEYLLKVKQNGNLALGGFYSDFRSSSMKGIFYLELSPENREIVIKKTTDFTEDFLSQFMSERKANKKRELRNFEVRQMYFRKDGGVQFLAEYYNYYVTTTTDANGRTTTRHHYDYGDIMVASMNSEGFIEWWSKIPKMQHMVNAGGQYAGMNYSFINNTICLVYNEHINNIDELDPDRLKNLNLKKAWTVLVTITSDGKVKKTPLFKSKESKTLLKPRFSIQASENELLILSEMAKKYRLCSITFK